MNMPRLTAWFFVSEACPQKRRRISPFSLAVPLVPLIFMSLNICLNIDVMDTREYLIRLFAYDAWANQEVVGALQAAPSSPPRALKFLAHILASERLWLERVNQQKQTFPVWPEFTLEDCKKQATELPLLWNNYLEASAEPDLVSSVSYKNTKGEIWSSRNDDILMHVIMHSAYHRGQIATDMRAAGLTPAYTDFIHSIRRGFVT